MRRTDRTDRNRRKGPEVDHVGDERQRTRSDAAAARRFSRGVRIEEEHACAVACEHARVQAPAGPALITASRQFTIHNQQQFTKEIDHAL